MTPLTVLSLCDGMSCGHIALDKIGIPVDKYYAAEIKNIAIKVTQHNYPNTIQLGNVSKISYKDGILYTAVGEFKVPHIDLMMWGSPCQTFSIAMKTNQRVGLENSAKSGLFYECYRIFKEVNPDYFLFENVSSMKKEDQEILSSYMGCSPVRLNAKNVSACLRDRLYWTNIPLILPFEDQHIKLENILTSGFTDREKARCLLASDDRPLTTPAKMIHRYQNMRFTTLIFKDKQHFIDCAKENEQILNGQKPSAKLYDNYTGHIFDGVRYLNQIELERCQGVPEGYTSILTRNEAANVLGDGWNINVISYILYGLRKI